MSKLVKGVGKVFKKIVKIAKVVLPIALAVAAVVFTGGAALGILPTFAAAAGGVVASLGIGGAVAGALTGAVVGAGFGSAIGGLSSAAQGGNILKGMQTGALTGAVTGGVTGALNPASFGIVRGPDGMWTTANTLKTGSAFGAAGSGNTIVKDAATGFYSKAGPAGLSPASAGSQAGGAFSNTRIDPTAVANSTGSSATGSISNFGVNPTASGGLAQGLGSSVPQISSGLPQGFAQSAGLAAPQSFGQVAQSVGQIPQSIGQVTQGITIPNYGGPPPPATSGLAQVLSSPAGPAIVNGVGTALGSLGGSGSLTKKQIKVLREQAALKEQESRFLYGDRAAGTGVYSGNPNPFGTPAQYAVPGRWVLDPRTGDVREIKV